MASSDANRDLVPGLLGARRPPGESGNVMLGPLGETLVGDWGPAKPTGRTFDPSARPEVNRDAGAGSGPGVDLPPTVDGKGEAPGSASPPPGPSPLSTALAPSSLEDGSETVEGSALGTPAFMSPEQAEGRLDRIGPASDVYSLGATLDCLLTGRAPFQGRDVSAILERAIRGDFPAPRQVERRVPAALEAICRKAMVRDPADRYASARRLAEDLESWLADGPVSASREPLARRLSRWARRHRAWAQAGAAALLLVAVVALAAAVVVDRARGRERAERLRADQQHVRALRLSADILRQKGQALCEQGDVARGLSWMARGLEAAPPEDSYRIVRNRDCSGRVGGRQRNPPIPMS